MMMWRRRSRSLKTNAKQLLRTIAFRSHRSKRLADPNRTVVCVKPFVDLNYEFKKGHRLPASHVLIARFPENFVEEIK